MSFYFRLNEHVCYNECVYSYLKSVRDNDYTLLPLLRQHMMGIVEKDLLEARNVSATIHQLHCVKRLDTVHSVLTGWVYSASPPARGFMISDSNARLTPG